MTRREFLKLASKLSICAASLPLFTSIINALFKNSNDTDNKESRYYKKLNDNTTQCLRCPVQCILKHKQLSFCQTRINLNGILYELSYNRPCIMNIDPLEKAPLYHIKPGINSIALGTAGCNLRCLYCQNWQISQKSPLETKNIDLTVEDVVKEVKERELNAIVFTYTEPVVFFDYMVDIADIARKYNIISHTCTSGYINKNPLLELCNKINSFTVTLKGFTEEFYNKVCAQSLKTVLNTIVTIKEQNKWLEIVNLIVPTLNDDYKQIKNMCKWIIDNLGREVPVHFTRFFPAFKLTNLPRTPQIILEDARKIAKDCGINYVYLDNIPGHEGNNTFCPYCGKELITRSGFKILANNIKNGKCKFCNKDIPGIWNI